MPLSPVAERLAAQASLAGIPDAQLEWLARHGVVQHYDDGQALYSQDRDDDPRGLYVVLSGTFSVRVNRAGVEREVRSVGPGEVTGYLPYSRMRVAAGYLVAVGPVEFLSIAENDIREMTRECYDFTALCVHSMLDRARAFKGDDLNREKMEALGRLSAGLAHELNNPASASARASDALDAIVSEMADAARVLGAARLSGDRLEAYEALEAAAGREATGGLSALEVANREEQLAAWLGDHDLDPDAAFALAGTCLGPAEIDATHGRLDGEELRLSVRFLAALAGCRQLTKSIMDAASRVQTLVTAVKSHTHMDRSAIPEPIVLGRHLGDAIALLQSRASGRDVSVALDVEPGLPAVQGVVGELNHVWFNLLANAVEAAPPSGHVNVSACCDRGCVVVDVVDDGPGIGEADLGRVFDPFFTTKDVGQGAGLGLNVAQAIVRGHGGTISVTSRPGHTAFRVILPVSGAEDARRNPIDQGSSTA